MSVACACQSGARCVATAWTLGAQKSRWKGVRRLPLVHACEILAELRHIRAVGGNFQDRKIEAGADVHEDGNGEGPSREPSERLARNEQPRSGGRCRVAEQRKRRPSRNVRADRPRRDIALTVAHEAYHAWEEHHGKPLDEGAAERFARALNTQLPGVAAHRLHSAHNGIPRASSDIAIGLIDAVPVP